MVTKKHFELVAKTISRIVDEEERQKMAEHNARLFAKSNSRFDRKRFLEACRCDPS